MVLIVTKFFSTSSKAFSRALTSTTVLVSSAMRLSLIDLTTSCGVLGLETLKNENDMMIR
uniref:Uncharacterized protein n=1 Tax=Medicago truncatula TaxID=3880 RepID=I3SY88_MEDTR|nr:unknown [Medicago truncatula]